MGFVRIAAICAVAIGCGDNIHLGRGDLLVSPRAELATTESGGSAVFTIALTKPPPSGSATITITSMDAGEGTVSPESLVFTTSNYDRPQSVTITGVDDLHADGNAPYVVEIDGGRTGLVDLDLVNIDDDTAGFAVAPIGALMTSEGGQQATFSVVLTSQPESDVTIPITSSDTTEGTTNVGSLSFSPDTWNVPQAVVVTGVNDVVTDGAVAYSVTLGAAASEDPIYAGLDPDDLPLVNVDDDLRGILVSPITMETNESGTQATFSVVLQTAPTATVTIGVASSDTGEASVSTTQLAFTPGDWDTPQTVTVTGVNDAIIDGDQPFTIALAPAASTDPLYSGFDPDDITGINHDNDQLGVAVSPTTITTTEAGGTATFTIVLLAQPSAPVTVSFASSDTSEGTVSGSSVVFTAADWNQPRTITVTGVDDTIADGPQAYSIVLAPTTSTDPMWAGVDPPDVAATNVDDDIPGFTVTPTSGLVVTEFLDTDSFTIVLNTQPLANVTVALTSSDTTEGTVSPSSVTFTPANWNIAQTVTVRGVNDNLADGNITFTIVTAPATSSDPAYAGLNPADVQVTNIDNDTPQVYVRTRPLLIVSENGTTATFRIGLTTQPSASVTCTLFSTDTTEGAVSPSNIVFTSTNWGARVITVLGLDDAVVDGDVGFTIITNACTSADPAYNGLNPRDVSVVNRDND